MARFPRLHVLNTMLDVGMIPVFYHPDLEVCKKVVKACAAGGARVFEFTNRGDHAVDVFAALELHCREQHPEVVLGVGSVIDEITAGMYVARGANFVVGPLLNPTVARYCNRRKIAYSPGCGSASEISAAEELGCEIIKIFPGMQVGGPAFVKSVLGPCPWVSMMPTGGVDCTEESLTSWFGAGVVCVGIGSKLIRQEWLQAGEFDAIQKNVADTLNIITRVRPAKKLLIGK